MKVSKEAETHLKGHMKYPASKSELMEACGKLSDISENEKMMVEKLPDRQYKDAEDVMKELEME